MAKIIHEIRVEVAKPNLFQAIVGKQGDYNSRFLKVTLVDGGEVIGAAEAQSVTINANRPDGASKRFSGEINTDGTVTVPLAAWMLELEGTVYCDISVIGKDDSKLTSASFEVKVEAVACPDSEISENEYFDVLQDLIGDTEKALDGFVPTTITWDGDTTGRDETGQWRGPYPVYKVSDLTPSKELLLGGTYKYKDIDTSIGAGKEHEATITEENITYLDENQMYLDIGSEMIAVVYATNVTIDGYEATIPSTGIYFGKREREDYNGTIDYTVVTEMTFGGANVKAYIDEQDAELRDYVDAKTAGAGGGTATEEWVDICNLTTTEDSVIDITTDANGNPFSLKKFYAIVWKSPKAGDTASNTFWAHATTDNIVGYKPLIQSYSTQAGTSGAMNTVSAEIKRYWFAEVRGGVNADGNVNVVLPNSGSHPYGVRPEMKNADPITGFRFTWGYSGALPAGTKVEIWGVRA